MRYVKLMALSLTVVTVLAQRTEAQVRVGVRSGVAISRISGDDLSNSSSKAGFLVGGYVDLGLSDIVGLELGMNFVRKGVEDADDTEEVKII